MNLRDEVESYHVLLVSYRMLSTNRLLKVKLSCRNMYLSQKICILEKNIRNGLVRLIQF